MQRTHTNETCAVLPISWKDRYADQTAAGTRLAEMLPQYRGGCAVVLALPPGGVALASEVARALRLPLDVLVVHPFAIRAYPSLTAGAVNEGGGLCLNAALLRLPETSLEAIWCEVRKTAQEVVGLVHSYRHGCPLPMFTRRPVILVDDGLGCGLSQLVALRALRHYHPQSRIVASPGGTTAVMQLIAQQADMLITLTDAEDAHSYQPQQWRSALGDDEAAMLLKCSPQHLMTD